MPLFEIWIKNSTEPKYVLSNNKNEAMNYFNSAFKANPLTENLITHIKQCKKSHIPNNKNNSNISKKLKENTIKNEIT